MAKRNEQCKLAKTQGNVGNVVTAARLLPVHSGNGTSKKGIASSSTEIHPVSTSVVDTKKSSRFVEGSHSESVVQPKTSRLPSVQGAAPRFSMGTDKEQLEICAKSMLSFLLALLDNSPGSDVMYLSRSWSNKYAEELGLTKEQHEEVIKRLLTYWYHRHKGNLFSEFCGFDV